MPNEHASPLQVLAWVTHTSPDGWEELDGPNSRVGIDLGYRNRQTGAEAYLNLDQGHLFISADDYRVYDAELPTETELSTGNVQCV
jgi:hypothetical protein